MILKFICTCNHEINPADLEDVGWWRSVATDTEGFLICVRHKERRKSWNSLPEGSSRQLADYRFASWTPLQREQFEVFGKPPLERSLDFDFNGEDRRDNRDPEQIGAAILAKQNGESRRHSEPTERSGEFGA